MRHAASAYIRDLLEETRWIEENGRRLPMEDAYVPRTALLDARRVELEEALRESRSAVVGAAASGKTTFLRHVAYLCCRGIEDIHTDSLLFPILIRAAEWAHCGSKSLPEFLGAKSARSNWGLAPEYFRQKLRDGGAIVLVDDIEGHSAVVEQACRDFPRSRFVVTARTGAAVPAGFHAMRIDI